MTSFFWLIFILVFISYGCCMDFIVLEWVLIVDHFYLVIHDSPQIIQRVCNNRQRSLSLIPILFSEGIEILWLWNPLKIFIREAWLKSNFHCSNHWISQLSRIFNQLCQTLNHIVLVIFGVDTISQSIILFLDFTNFSLRSLLWLLKLAMKVC